MKSDPPDVLIITQAYDPTTDFLIPYLEKAGLNCERWDPGNMPSKDQAGMKLCVGQWTGFHIRTSDGFQFNLDEVGVVYYRRPSASYSPIGTPTKDLIHFINSECSQFMANFWRCTSVPMVNDPIIGYAASHKANQLKVAHSLGLRVPITYMGNNPAEIRDLWQLTKGNMIVKAFIATVVDKGDGDERTLYTTSVTEQDLVNDAHLCACPSIWQEKIEKKVEIRVTVLGERVFAGEIHSQDQEKTRDDWRNVYIYQALHKAHKLPFEIEEKCIKLIKDFNLHYGAIDLILTPANEYVFLENNPFGQWAWMQEMCDLPIAEGHVDLFRNLISAR